MESLKSIYNNMSDMSKLLIKMLLGIVAALIVLFLIVFVIKLVRGGSSSQSSFAKVENAMVTSAQKYYKKNKDELPTEGQEAEVTVEQLVSSEYMKDLEKYVGKKTKCTGSVVVLNNSDNYAYVPSLDCGEDYNTQFLSDSILENNDVTEQGAGLYLDEEDNYIFKGEYVNNYLKIGEMNFRILRINSDGTIRIMLADPLKNHKNSRWDDRYNVEKGSNSGINDYSVSRIREELQIIYDDEEIFPSNLKAYIVPQTLCIGPRNAESNDFTDEQECSETLENEYIGLIQANEYLLASIDDNCESLVSNSCSNYNYLANFNRAFWTITPSDEDTYHNYRISKYPSAANTTSVSNILFTIHLSSKTTLTSGTGTVEDPFIVKISKK